MQLPNLSCLTAAHTGLTCLLGIGLAASAAALQHAGAREETVKFAMQERDTRIDTLTREVTETRKRAEDLERSSHVVTTRTVLPSGEVRERKEVDTRVSDKSQEADTAKATERHDTTVTRSVSEHSETTRKPSSQPTWSVAAWRAGLAAPQWGATVGLRLGPLPAWAEAGWLLGSGPLVGIRMEFN